MTRFALLIFFFVAFLSFRPLLASPTQAENTITRDILQAEKITGLDRKMIYTFIKIESHFEPFSITITEWTKQAKRLKRYLSRYHDIATIKLKSYSKNENKKIINIYAINEKAAIKIAKDLYRMDIKNFDMGIMQVNRCNLSSIDDVDLMFDPIINMLYALRHVVSCYERYGTDVMEVIECYNKGFKKKDSYSYYRKFVRSYSSDFL